MPAAAWLAMTEAVKPNPMRFGFVGTDLPDALKQHRAIAAEAWRIELTTPRTILESYKVLRVGASEIDKYRDGLSILDPHGRLDEPRRPVRPEQGACAG